MSNPEYLIGLAKKDMTCNIPGLGMMGYGQNHNRVKDVMTPLMVRACVIENQGQVLFFACLEQCMVTIAISSEVQKRLAQKFPNLNLAASNFIITAQHTHSAPGGYSHYPFYNFSTPSFQTRVFEKVVETTVDALIEAYLGKKNSRLVYGEITFPLNVNVAFNRSLAAYKKNPESKNDLTQAQAVDRVMRALKIYQEGKLIGMLNFFGVHCTSVSSYNDKIHHDNKGVAAALFEQANPECIAIFAQEAAGDVSPNWIKDIHSKLRRGISPDQYICAEYNGKIQFDFAQKLPEKIEVSGAMKLWSGNLNMSKLASPPAHGVAFFKGTAEGPGVSPAIGNFLKIIATIAKWTKFIFAPRKNIKFYRDQGNKDIVLDHRTGELLGIPLRFWKLLPFFPDPLVNQLIKELKLNALNSLPWSPPILPIRATQIGQVLILAVPGEITTMAAKRLKNRVAEITGSWNLEKITIVSYSNAFMGYITTQEEYEMQCYEGGHTIYGKDTLRVLIQGFVELLEDKLPPTSLHSVNLKELKLRSV